MTYQDRNFEHFVYVLRHPDTHELKYVGCSNHPEKRVLQHARPEPSMSPNRKKYNWIRELNGREPELQIIAGFKNRIQAEYFEALLIKSYLITGVDLVNVAHNKKIT